jgi:hypothetical protein
MGSSPPSTQCLSSLLRGWATTQVYPARFRPLDGLGACQSKIPVAEFNSRFINCKSLSYLEMERDTLSNSSSRFTLPPGIPRAPCKYHCSSLKSRTTSCSMAIVAVRFSLVLASARARARRRSQQYVEIAKPPVNIIYAHIVNRKRFRRIIRIFKSFFPQVHDRRDRENCAHNRTFARHPSTTLLGKHSMRWCCRGA